MGLRRYDATQGGTSLRDPFGPQAVKERPALQVLFYANKGLLSKLNAPYLHKRPLKRVVFLLLLCRDEGIRTLGLQLPKLAR